jgi:hypothetical protein
VVAIRPGYRDMIDPWRPGWFRLAVVALVATVLLGWYGLLRKRFGAWALTLGSLFVLAFLGLVLAAATPGGSYLAALPALAGAGAGLVTLTLLSEWGRLLAWTVGGAVAVLILAPTVLLFFPALGLATGAAAALFATMLGLALLPVFEYVYPLPSRRLWSSLPSVVAGVLTVACVGVGLAVDRFDAAHPAPTQLMYALDTDTGQARWLSAETSPAEWTSQYVTGTEDVSAQFPLFDEELATGPAQATALPAPELSVVSDSTVDGQRRLVLSVRPQRAVRLVYLHIEGEAKVVEANVGGRAIPVSADKPFSLLFHAPPPEGITVRVTLDSAKPVKARVMDGSDGLDALPGFHPRPPGVGVDGSHDSELVLVARTYPL